mmetsp:Transcript_29360/g.60139  ORF Transcript_29360/g.60139 Transcript_29360/m.60139 type:complete len:213 (-) Transcript_29360:406-1044(-)
MGRWFRQCSGDNIGIQTISAIAIAAVVGSCIVPLAIGVFHPIQRQLHRHGMTPLQFPLDRVDRMTKVGSIPIHFIDEHHCGKGFVSMCSVSRVAFIVLCVIAVVAVVVVVVFVVSLAECIITAVVIHRTRRDCRSHCPCRRGHRPSIKRTRHSHRRRRLPHGLLRWNLRSSHGIDAAETASGAIRRKRALIHRSFELLLLLLVFLLLALIIV